MATFGDQAFLQQAGLKFLLKKKWLLLTIMSFLATITPLPNQEAFVIIVSPQGDHFHELDLTNTLVEQLRCKLLSDEQPCRIFLMGVQISPEAAHEGGINIRLDVTQPSVPYTNCVHGNRLVNLR